jgi:serine/threonine protein kinase
MGVALRLKMAQVAKAAAPGLGAACRSASGSADSVSKAEMGAIVDGPIYHVVQTASDMWAVGVVAWELLTGSPLFGDTFTDEDVVMVLLGFKPLPFETDPSLWVLFNDPKVSPCFSWHRCQAAEEPAGRTMVSSITESSRRQHSAAYCFVVVVLCQQGFTCFVVSNVCHAQAANLLKGLLVRRPEQRLTASRCTL